MRKARYRIEGRDHDRCTLRDEDGEVREFWCPSGGGYVYEITPERPGTSGWQVCERLAPTGVTLRWSARAPLAQLIRREIEAQQRPGKIQIFGMLRFDGSS